MMYQNYTSLSYLSKCDLISRLGIQNVNECPEVSKVILDLNLRVNNSKITAKKSKLIKLQKFLIFNLLFGTNGKFVNFQRVIKVAKKEQKIAQIFEEQLVFKKKLQIESFLYFLFIENNFKFLCTGIPFKNLIRTSSSLTFKVNIPLSLFDDLRSVYSAFSRNFNLEKSTVTISFIIENVGNVNKENVRVLFPFGHFG